MSFRIIEGDCIEAMAAMEPNSVDAIVTDPPYGLEFMGKEWDRLGDIGKTSHAGPKDRGTGDFGGFRVAFSGSSNVKCQNCGSWKWDHEGRKCECDAPSFPNVKAHQARIMGEWHHAWATEALRVLKPGGHLLAFGGTRTYHRLTCAIEDAGFEIRDCLAWLYGSGFPKSLDVSKAIDKAAGREAADTEGRYAETFAVTRWLHRQIEGRGITSGDVNAHFGASNVAQEWLMVEMGKVKRPRVPRWDQWEELRAWLGLPDEMDAEVWRLNGNKGQPAPLAFARDSKMYAQSHGFARVGLKHGAQKSHTATAQVEELGYATGPGDTPATPDAQHWNGWGTALKPAFEPIVLARKPLSERNVAANVLRWGTGALNIDGCRIEGEVPQTVHGVSSRQGEVYGKFRDEPEPSTVNPAGRWPANVTLDETAAAMLDEQSGDLKTQNPATSTLPNSKAQGVTAFSTGAAIRYPEATGGASRFFYCPKADRAERNNGLGHMASGEGQQYGSIRSNRGAGYPDATPAANTHPTVKPIALMAWLCRMVTPKGGTVLDPFTGSGSTGIAALREGFEFVGIEREPEYCEIARDRITGDAPLFNEEVTA